MASARVRGAWLAALGSTALTCFTAPAFAQESADANAAAINPNEIIVSARRRTETLQETPVAITAINAAMLENKASVNIGDLQGAAPNLLITQQNSGAQAANLSIRGLTYADIEKSQEPTVGVVIDGVFIGTNTGQLLDFFDIEQIEVLRGPQGTLFGRNTIGGVINIRRSRPTKTFGVKAEASYSKWDTWATRAVLNVGDDDTFGVKAWYFHNQSDGFYRHGVTGERAGGSNNENYGASLLFTPQGGTFDALLTVEQQEQEFDVVNSNLARTDPDGTYATWLSGEMFCLFEPANECDRNNTDDLYTVFNSPGISRYRAPSATLEMNLDVGAVTLTSITGWRKSTEHQTQDFDSSTADLYYVLRNQHYRQISQELRASGKLSSAFDYVVGAYYFNSKYDLTQWTRLFGFDPSVDPTVADPNPQMVEGKTESYALFGDFNWAFADDWRLSFGGRWTHDHKELTNANAVTGPVGDGAATFKKFTPKVGIDWRPNSDTMLYASWSRGYRSGGFSPRAATPDTASTPYFPETVDSYEVGAKFDLLDRHLQFNIAGFISKYDGMQQTNTIPGGPRGNQTVTVNVGSATIKGIEADITARPVDGLKLTATVGILDSKFKDFIVGNVSPDAPPLAVGPIVPFDYSANNLIYAPKFSGSLGAEYTVPTGFGSVVANASVRHISSYDQQISLGPLTVNRDGGGAVTSVVVNGNDPRVRTPSQDLFDASMTFNFDMSGTEAYLTVFGRNLLDERLAGSSFTVAGLWSFASAIEPRTYGATVGVRF
jgi:iron complex outermembrane receptor protein